MNFFIPKKELKVYLWSFGDEGKTTLLYRGLKGKKDFQTTFHTVGYNAEPLTFNKRNMVIWDIGGACQIKELRNNYLPYCDALIFLIDSSISLDDQSFDSTKFKENYEEFKKCIEIIKNKPLLIAITKVDIRKTSTYDIIDFYQLQDLFKRQKKFGIIECSSFTSQGIKEILYWISSIEN